MVLGSILGCIVLPLLLRTFLSFHFHKDHEKITRIQFEAKQVAMPNIKIKATDSLNNMNVCNYFNVCIFRKP